MRWSAFGRRLAAACVVTAVLVAGCSTSTSSSTSTGSSSPSSTTSTSTSSSTSNAAICSDAQNLKASLQSLKNVSIRESGLSAISDLITKIKQQLQTFKNNAHNQFATPVNALTNTLNGASSSLEAAKASPSALTLVMLGSSVRTVITAGQTLVTTVSSTC